MRWMFCLVLLTLPVGAFAAPEDDLFESENKSGTAEEVKTIADKTADAPYKTSDVAKLKKLDGETITVSGKVMSTYKPEKGTMVILNFGKDHDKCFKVVLEESKKTKLQKGLAGIAKEFEGKVVVVEGTISLYEGLPQMKLDDPHHIRIKAK